MLVSFPFFLLPWFRANSLVTRVFEERARVIQAESDIVRAIEELSSQLAELRRRREHFIEKGRELVEFSMAELEALEAEERVEEQA